jgi:hypothetical protein
MLRIPMLLANTVLCLLFKFFKSIARGIHLNLLAELVTQFVDEVCVK